MKFRQSCSLDSIIVSGCGNSEGCLAVNKAGRDTKSFPFLMTKLTSWFVLKSLIQLVSDNKSPGIVNGITDGSSGTMKMPSLSVCTTHEAILSRWVMGFLVREMSLVDINPSWYPGMSTESYTFRNISGPES